MEVVCLILGPMLASQPCLHVFWVLTSLYLLSFLLYVSLTRACVAYVVKEVGQLGHSGGLGQLMGVVHNRTRAQYGPAGV